jgi:hypothetical protein
VAERRGVFPGLERRHPTAPPVRLLAWLKSSVATLSWAAILDRAATPKVQRFRAALARRHVRGWMLRRPVLGLTVASLVAAVLADRFAGPNGPWLWNYDSLPVSFPAASFVHEMVTQGRLPLWDDRLGIGYPRYAEGVLGVFYPPTWLIYQLPPLVAMDVARILHLTLAGVGSALIALRLGGSRLGALCAALVAILCGAVVARLQWVAVGIIVDYGWMPWVLMPLLWPRGRLSAGCVAVAGILWGVQALALHPSYWVMTGMAAGVIIVARTRDPRGILKGVLFGFVGVGVGAIQVVPTLLLTAYSPRGHGLDPSDLFRLSATPFDFLLVAFSNAFVPSGSPSWNLLASWYPGGTWAIIEGYAYVGLTALALAAIGFRTRRGRPLAVVAAMAIAIPIIAAFRPFLWDQIPILSGLRYQVRWYLVLDLVLAVAAGVGVARLGRTRSVRLPTIVVGLMLGGYALVAAGVAFAPDWLNMSAYGFGDAATIRTLAGNALFSPWPLLFEVGAVGCALLLIQAKPSVSAARIAVVMLVGVPLAVLVPGFNQSLPANAFAYDGTSLVQTIRSLQPHRVVTIADPFYGGIPDQTAGGYADLFNPESLPLGGPVDLLALVWSNPRTPFAPAAGIDTEVVFGASCIAGREVAFDRSFGARVCHLDNAARPPYWLPAALVSLPGGATASGTSPVDALIDPVQALGAAAPAAVQVWDTMNAVIQVGAHSAGYLYIDRAWWFDWQITVDGQPVRPLRAMAGQLVPVPAGDHVVEEHLVLADAGIGAVVSAGTLAMLGLWFVVSRRRTRVGRLRVLRDHGTVHVSENDI